VSPCSGLRHLHELVRGWYDKPLCCGLPVGITGIGNGNGAYVLSLIHIHELPRRPGRFGYLLLRKLAVCPGNAHTTNTGHGRASCVGERALDRRHILVLRVEKWRVMLPHAAVPGKGIVGRGRSNYDHGKRWTCRPRFYCLFFSLSCMHGFGCGEQFVCITSIRIRWGLPCRVPARLIGRTKAIFPSARYDVPIRLYVPRLFSGKKIRGNGGECPCVSEG
jgi:hypothetical protein